MLGQDQKDSWIPHAHNRTPPAKRTPDLFPRAQERRTPGCMQWRAERVSLQSPQTPPLYIYSNRYRWQANSWWVFRFLMIGIIHRNLSAATESIRPRTPDSTTSILLLPTETRATPRNAPGTSNNKIRKRT